MRKHSAPIMSTQHQPKMASRERLLDAEFLEGAAEDWECPVCKLTLLDPFLLSCCGNHLCESCVGRLAGKPCPLCSHKFTGLLDKGRQRGVWQAKVRCSNYNGGCEWQGELRYLLRHLQPADGEGPGQSPAPRGPVPLCLFERVPCANEGCGQRLPRKDLEQHQQSECVHRKVRCQYCNEVETTYEELCNVHWGECPDFPVACPNNCDVGGMRRSQVQTHCDRDCKLQPVRCPFFDLGCPAKQRPRKELQNHVNTAQLYHGQLLARNIVDIQRKQEAVVAKEEVERVNVAMQEQLRQRDEIIQRLGAEAGERMTVFTKFVDDTNARFEAMRNEFTALQANLEEKQNAKEEEFNGILRAKDEELKKNDEKLEKLEKELAKNVQRLEQVRAELQVRLADVDREQATRLEEMEKMRLEMEDKEKEERGQVGKMIGELEEKLMEQIEQKQPKDEFIKLENGLANVTRLVEKTEEKFTAKLEDAAPKQIPVDEKKELLASIEQKLDEKLKTHTAEYEKRKEEIRESRAEIEEMLNEFAEEVNGKVEKQAEVNEGLEKEVERVSQELIARVDDVMREVEYVEKAATPTPPFSFTVSRFTKRREKKDSFVSEPFYTSRRGYRMVMRVDAAGTDTHVSVWCCITRGQHDDIIPWPLRADIFVRLINQRDKDKYYERQISYDNVARDKHAGKVVTGDKNYLWGLREFITLREIQSGQYLVGDALDFVVNRVELKEMDRPL